jgi:hypothetical protein
MRELYRMRARQCRATAAVTQDIAERYKLERIAWEWDQLAAQQADDPAASNVIPFERLAEARRRRARRASRLAGGAAPDARPAQ